MIICYQATPFGDAGLKTMKTSTMTLGDDATYGYQEQDTSNHGSKRSPSNNPGVGVSKQANY